MRKTYATPATPHERAIIEGAERFSIFAFVGRSSRHKGYASTAEEARGVARVLAGETRRPAIIYAIKGGAAAYLETIQP